MGGRFNWTVFLDNKTMPALNIMIYSNVMSNIQSMTIRYLIISSFWCDLAFVWYWEPVMSGVSSSSPYSTSVSALTSVNMTGTVNCFSVLTGFDVTAASSAVN